MRLGDFDELKKTIKDKYNYASATGFLLTMKNVLPQDVVYQILTLIDNAPAVYDNPYSDGREDGYIEGYEEGKKEKPQLSDEQIEEITDLLENEWGYEGMREDVERILRGAESAKWQNGNENLRKEIQTNDIKRKHKERFNPQR